MAGWRTPSPIFVTEATGARLVCADGHAHADFCLADTAAMFGHAPPPLVRALAGRAARGIEFNDTAALELVLSDRGVACVVAEPVMPFHNMMLCSPASQVGDVEALLAAMGGALDELAAG